MDWQRFNAFVCGFACGVLFVVVVAAFVGTVLH